MALPAAPQGEEDEKSSSSSAHDDIHRQSLGGFVGLPGNALFRLKRISPASR